MEIKKISLITFFLCIVCFNNKSQGVKNGFPEINNFERLKAKFLSPSNEYAPHSFWFWNDSLNKKKSVYMAREMARKGMNPGYIHPRYYRKSAGLPVDQWLSEEYFKCIEDVLNVCETTNTYLGFCDDYWWPTGRIGGRMVTRHPKMQARELAWERWKKVGTSKVYLPPNEFIVACQELKPGVINTKTLQVISTGENKEWIVPDGEWIIYIFNVVPSPSRSRGPDQILVNYMEPKLSEYVIDMGLKPYETYLGEYMGKSLKYCFSDNEGEYGNCLPWSKYLIEFYEELYGDDIRRWIPLLLTEDNDGKWVTARYRWFNMISEMYANKFWKPINDWLAERGLYYISNFWEANLMLQAATVGDYFRVNRAFSFPGNDCLMMGAYDLIHFKEIQSICEFENRPFMSEIMGVQGWQQLPTEMKEVANLATAWGVTQIVPHGMNLNRDLKNCIHPADWFEENPYWQTMKAWTNFCKRASMINRQGSLATNILIYNPMTSIWSLSDNFLSGRASSRHNWENSKASKINDKYYGIQKALTERHAEYLIADDFLMTKSTVDKKDKQLNIRDHNFSVLYLPPLFTVKIDVYKKILDFASVGGKVVLLGELPVSSPENGLNDPVILQINKELLTYPNVLNFSTNDEGTVCQEASQEANPAISLKSGNFKLYSSHRIIDGIHFYWLANNSGKKQLCEINLDGGTGEAKKWDCETGEIISLNHLISEDKKLLYLEFMPYEGFWLVFDKEKHNDKITIGKSNVIKIKDNWKIRIDDKEVMVSTAGICIDARNINTPENIEKEKWNNQNIVWPFNIYGDWKANWTKSNIKKEYGYFIHDFNINGIPTEGYLNLSIPEGSKLFINGNNVGLPRTESWKEPALINIQNFVQKGNNRIAIKTGKFVAPGDYWMLAQGEIFESGNKITSIITGENWWISESAPENWKNPAGSLEGFSPVQEVSWDNLTWVNKGEIHQPTKYVIKEDEIVWLKFNVPPGADKFETGINNSEIEVWMDTVKAESIDNEIISLKSDTRHVFLKAPKSNLKFTKPLVFSCGKTEKRPLVDWEEWGLNRYSGFVEYEQEVMLDSTLKGKKTILKIDNAKYVVKVEINENKVGERMWPPFNFDISDYIVPGRNKIVIKVGNLIVNRMALYDDFNQLHRWGFNGIPETHYFNAGLYDSVKIEIIGIEDRLQKIK